MRPHSLEGWWLVKRKYSIGQYVEVIVIVTIILIVLYRMALAYDFIPEKYQPSAIASELYVDFKKRLKVEAALKGSTSDLAQKTLDKLNAIEKYMHERSIAARKAEMLADRCQENSIFRFFMYMGDQDEASCTTANLRTQQAVQELRQDAHGTTQAPAETVQSYSGTATPATTTPNPTPTAIPQSAPYVAPSAPVVQPSTLPRREPVSTTAPSGN